MKIREVSSSVRQLIGLLLLAQVLLFSNASAQVVDENFNVSGLPAPFRYFWEDPVTGEPGPLNGQLIYEPGDLGRQENEPYCGEDPSNTQKLLCAFNWYGFSDRPELLGDAWIAVAEKFGNKWYRRPLTGTPQNFPLNKAFAADPIVRVFPGGALVFALVGDRNGNSAMVVWKLMQLNRESGFQWVTGANPFIIEDLGGVHFIDKPAAQVIPDPDGGCTDITLTLEEKDPQTGEHLVETRCWPNATVVVSFADFGGSGQNIRTWSIVTHDWFQTQTNKTQISNTSGLDQGLAVDYLDDEVLYVWRRFDSGEGRASIMGALSRDRGEKPRKPFEITDVCEIDQQTAPNPDNPNRASSRSNAFPWLSSVKTELGSFWVLVYAERPRAGNNCLFDYGAAGVGGTRIMIRTSPNGRTWSPAVPVTPFNKDREPFNEPAGPNTPPVHFQFMPTVACARGSCMLIYYSTLIESLTYDAFLQSESVRHWETNPFIEDFSVQGDTNRLYYRRFLDVFANKIDFGAGGTPIPSVSERVTRFQTDPTDTFEIQWNPANILNYGGMTLPFIGDYIGLGVSEWHKDQLTGAWKSNKEPIGSIDDPINNVSYLGTWTDNRQAHGIMFDDDFFEGTTQTPMVPYEVPETATGSAMNGDEVQSEDNLGDEAEQIYVADQSTITESDSPLIAQPGGGTLMDSDHSLTNEEPSKSKSTLATVSTKGRKRRPDRFLSAYPLSAEGVIDINPNAATCDPVNFPQLWYQTGIKDSEIYGGIIHNKPRIVSPAVTKNLGVIQRGFLFGVESIDPDNPQYFVLVVGNQPGQMPPVTNPVPVVLPTARASWRQLPFGPLFDDSAGGDPLPEIEQFVTVQPLSTEYVTLFVVSQQSEAPVTVFAFEFIPDPSAIDPDTGEALPDPVTGEIPGTRGDLVSQITVNGQSEAGDLIDPGTTPQNVLFSEVHDPSLVEPIWSEIEIIELNPNYKNPNFKNTSSENPNLKNTEYMDPNYKNPNFKNETLGNPNLKNTTAYDNPNLKNPNLKNPNFKNEAVADSFIDLTYLVVAENNTTTGTNADFAYGGDELDDLNIEVIAWQADELDSLQGCETGVISENKVISARSSNPNLKNPNLKNPNLKNLAPADVADPFQGFISFPVEPGTPESPGRVFVTVRIFCQESGLEECSDLTSHVPNPFYDPDAEHCSNMDPDDDDEVCESTVPKLQANFGHNFWAQKANTDKCDGPLGSEETCQIGTDHEQIIKDVVPPAFENVPPNQTVEAAGPGGAVVMYTDPTAADSSGIADPPGVVCTPGSGSTFILGTTTVTCTVTDLANPPNTATATFDVTVVDTTAPVFDPPLPSDIGPVPATSSLGADVTYTPPTATDAVAGSITGDCIPPSGSNFMIGTTTVTCDADDGNGNVATVTFDVTVVDATGPVFNSQPPDIENVEATSTSGAEVTYSAPTADDDVDGTVTAVCSPASGSVFPFGDSTVSCTATDISGNASLPATFNVSVVDTTGPAFSGVPDDISVEATSPDGADVTYTPPTATDLGQNIPVTCSPASGSTFAIGDTTVTCTATDTTGVPPNTSEATFVVTVEEFEFGTTGITSTKQNAKTGSSIPTFHGWTNDSDVPQDVTAGTLNMSVRLGSCPGNQLAQTPGNSGFQLLADFSYQWNFQAVDNNGDNLCATRQGTTYCLTVTLTHPLVPSGQSQNGEVTLRGSDSVCE